MQYCAEFKAAVCQQLLCEECRSDTFSHRRFQLIVLGLQLADQRAADEILLCSLRGKLRCDLKVGMFWAKQTDPKRWWWWWTHGGVDVLHFLQVGPAPGHTGLHQQVLGAALLRWARVQIGVANVLQQGRVCGRHASKDLRDIGDTVMDDSGSQLPVL